MTIGELIKRLEARHDNRVYRWRATEKMLVNRHYEAALKDCLKYVDDDDFNEQVEIIANTIVKLNEARQQLRNK